MDRRSACIAVASALIACGPPPPVRAPAAAALSEAPQQRSLDRSDLHRYRIEVANGESREVIVTQDGVDVVVELLAPGGAKAVELDSPNGAHGDERLEIIAGARGGGTYEVVVRALGPGEPGGRYRIRMTRRDAAATARLLAERAAARAAAVGWLRDRAGAVELRPDGSIAGDGLARFDLLARRARVLGLGEATHGSRAIADARLALVRRLVEHHGVRLIALEASASRMREIDRWTRAPAAHPGALEHLLGPGWINRRAFAALATWTRTWNTAYPGDPVSLVGLDDQDNAPARDALLAFARTAFDAPYASRIAAALARIAKADAQAAVFGPSDVSADDWRFLRGLNASLEARRPLLAVHHGAAATDDAIAAARTIAQFAELNAGAPDEPTLSRDAFMAAGLLRALGPSTRAAYLAHNEHVRRPVGAPRWPLAGGLLATALGTDYAAVGSSFLHGGFLAQLANDPRGRLQAFSTSAPDAALDDSLDGALGALDLGDAAIAAWPDGAAGAPPWLRAPRPMHWIGAVFAAAAAPNQARRDSALLESYDGVVFLREVDAETPPSP